jgi:predicted Rossmann fold nucleotide-binding protein DprA/Smf involved in DNA uptake
VQGLGQRKVKHGGGVLEVNDMDLYWVCLATINGIGPVNSKKLLAKFETPHRIYDANEEELRSLCMMDKSYADIVVNSRSLAKAEKIMEYCHKNDIKLLTFSDKLYPEEVKVLKKSPILLYYKGTLIKNSMGVGIVGQEDAANMEGGWLLKQQNIWPKIICLSSAAWPKG